MFVQFMHFVQSGSCAVHDRHGCKSTLCVGVCGCVGSTVGWEDAILAKQVYFLLQQHLLTKCAESVHPYIGRFGECIFFAWQLANFVDFADTKNGTLRWVDVERKMKPAQLRKWTTMVSKCKKLFCTARGKITSSAWQAIHDYRPRVFESEETLILTPDGEHLRKGMRPQLSAAILLMLKSKPTPRMKIMF